MNCVPWCNPLFATVQIPQTDRYYVLIVLASVLGTKLPFSYFFLESLLKEFAADLRTPVITQSELLRIGGAEIVL